MVYPGARPKENFGALTAAKMPFADVRGWKRLGSPFDEWLHLILPEKRNDSSFVCEWEENADIADIRRQLRGQARGA